MTLNCHLFDEKENVDIPPFVVGDHVYKSCVIENFKVQHHAIVLDVTRDDNSEGGWVLEIADCHRLRKRECPAVGWIKVKYGVALGDRLLGSSSKALKTAAQCNPVALILARVKFLIENPDVVSEFELVHADRECLAVWCKTGRWATVEVSSYLSIASRVQTMGCLATVGSAVLPVTVPASGLWGYLGYTVQISLFEAAPIIPLIAVGGVVATTIIAWQRYQRKWRDLTYTLNRAFETDTAE